MAREALSPKDRLSSLIKGRVTEAEANAFSAAAAAEGLTPSSYLRRIVQIIARQGEAESAPRFAEGFGEGSKNETIRVRVPAAVKAGLEDMTEAEGMTVSAWVYRQILIGLTKGPAFAGAELNGLRQAVQALNAVGRNLNQISRAINVDPVAAIGAGGGLLGTIEDLQIELATVRARIDGLAEASISRGLA